jgi:hypothetical protein
LTWTVPVTPVRLGHDSLTTVPFGRIDAIG